MPNTASARKALRQSARRHTRNTARLRTYRQLAKDLRKLTTAKSSEAAALLPKVYQAIDKAAKARAIKANKASRLKSRLARLVNPARSETSRAISN
ncbi:MAG: 30S ribosomal protein S20 [Candidatus Liptonbacteria bacterium]|nr:30S ribosomal protein S20 [Candidatus Liptonbacteria bacterium]